MLTYSFQNIDHCSLYEHLYRCIRDDILSGKLPGEEKLPSKRAFAAHLGVSVITVENAYAQLVAEGYIYSSPKRGFFVQQLERGNLPRIRPSQSAPVFVSHAPKFEADLVSNHIPPENFPFSTWAKLLRGVLTDLGEQLIHAPSAQGERELQQAICKHLYSFRGMSVSPEQVVIGAGTEYLYGLLVQLLGRDSIYGVEDPGYQKPAQIYESNGAECVLLPMDDAGVRFDCLEDSNVNVLHISPSHHFPTGIVMPISRRYELLGWCARDDRRYILEDDYDCEFRSSGKPIPTLQSIDASDRVIYINTFSKTLASAMRISYMVLPQTLVKPFREKLGFYSCTVSSFEQLALARFIQDGYFEKHINRMRNLYHNQKNEILQQLKCSDVGNQIKISMENEGLHFLLSINCGISDRELIGLAAQHGLRIATMSQYFNTPPDKSGILVINYAGITAKETQKIVARLVAFLKDAIASGGIA